MSEGDTTESWRDRLTRTGRIARWEIMRSVGTVDKTTLGIILVLGLVIGGVGATVADSGVGLEDEIYVVGIDEDNPYYDVADSSAQFRTVPVGADGADITFPNDREIQLVDETTAEPALEAFSEAIATYNEELMAGEHDETAAYPVLVTVEYQDRTLEDGAGEPPATDAGEPRDDGDTDDGAADDGEATDETGTDDGAADDPSTDDSGEPTGDVPDDTDGGLAVPDVGGSLEDASQPGSPSTLEPPFPFQSLVLAFLIIIPMNFVIQVYGSTIMDERLKRRGELLLVSPASRYEIVAGKTLPYLAGLVGIVLGIAFVIGGGLLSIAAAVPIALAFLSATFMGAMFARSFKELTFVTVTISVFLTAYTFIPAIFTDVTPIALISPLTLIVMDLQNESVALAEYVFSTGPFYFGSAVMFLLGIGIYREEDMFTQKALPRKALDAIASRVHGLRSIFVLPILFLPFVFAAQLLTVALVFALPEAYALPVLFVVAAAVEELAKSIHVYAGFARSRLAASIRTAVIVGAVAGTGFFVGEKLTHIVQFVGLPDLLVGQAAFGPELSANPLILALVFFAPLVLHVVTAIIGALGASRGTTQYAVAFVIATIVHAAYNMGVIYLVA